MNENAVFCSLCLDGPTIRRFPTIGWPLPVFRKPLKTMIYHLGSPLTLNSRSLATRFERNCTLIFFSFVVNLILWLIIHRNKYNTFSSCHISMKVAKRSHHFEFQRFRDKRRQLIFTVSRRDQSIAIYFPVSRFMENWMVYMAFKRLFFRKPYWLESILRNSPIIWISQKHSSGSSIFQQIHHRMLAFHWEQWSNEVLTLRCTSSFVPLLE